MERSSRQLSVLLVEGSRDDEEATIHTLTKSKLVDRTIVARNGAEALEVLLPEETQPGRDETESSLVLLALDLPKMNGLDLLVRLRRDDRTRETPVVILTSSKKEHDLIRAYKAGANDFIRKPLTVEKLRETLRKLRLPPLANDRPSRGDRRA